MCYKDEVQKKNAIKLQKKFQEDNVPVLIQTYLNDFDSKLSAINYWIAIRDLLKYLMNERVIDKNEISDILPQDFYEIEAEDISAYLRYKESKGMSPTTLGTRKNIFKSFWDYLKRTKKCPVKENIIDSVSYKGVSTNYNLIKKLPSGEQIQNMEEKIMKKKDPFVRIRNIMILRVLKGTGIRESELAGLDMTDLFLDEEMPYIKVLGKGKYREIEMRTVYLTGDARNAIKEWLNERGKIENIIDVNAVFLNKNGKRLSEDNIQSIFKNYGNGLSPHMIRHWYATVMVNKGGIAFTQQQLGHANSNITINTYANGSYGMKDVLINM